MVNLDTTHVDELYRAMLNANLALPEKKRLSRATIDNNLKALQRSLKNAVGEGPLVSNPFVAWLAKTGNNATISSRVPVG